MTLLELLDYTRSEVLRDSVEPYLYSEDALLLYANEGLLRLARHTYLFTDQVNVVTVEGTPDYQLPSSTLHVFAVYNPEGRSLPHYTRRAKPYDVTGRPYAFSTDAPVRSLRFYPTPDDAYEFSVWRAHTPDLMELSDDVPLDHDHALMLSDWIAHKALRNNDPDGSNMVASDAFLRAWTLGIQTIRRDVVRLAMGDNPSAQPRKWV